MLRIITEMELSSFIFSFTLLLFFLSLIQALEIIDRFVDLVEALLL